MPDEVEYLIDWTYELVGRSGVGMSGVAPLTYTTVEAWARLKDIGELHPMEVEALLLFDSILLTRKETTGGEESNLPKEPPKWPSKKA